MARQYWKTVEHVIDKADIILMVMDSRYVERTRNQQIERMVSAKNKALIYVLNKCDLMDKEKLDAHKKTMHPCVFVSAKDYHGMKMLRDRIHIEGSRAGLAMPKVGVVGYPNMGKSSIINALSGRGAARTSREAGFTKGKQFINARTIKLIDTPGVIPFEERGDKSLAMDNAIAGIRTNIKDPQEMVYNIMKEYPGSVERHFDVEMGEDIDDTLERIARKLNLIKKGDEPDTYRTAQQIIKQIQQGKIQL